MKLRTFAAAVFACLALACPARGATLLPNGEQCFSATVGLNGMVGTLGAITGGSLYTAGTYGGVALTGGSGTGATATITVAAGAVTGVTILAPGKNYVTGDVLSAAVASIGGTGAGFSVPVASVAVNSALAGGTIDMFVPNNLIPKPTWKDAAQTQLNTQPIILDANGCAIIYGSGTYRQILKDALGNLIWDQTTADYSATNSPFWAGLAGGTPNAITVTDPAFNGTDGQSIAFLALSANTGPTTLNPSGFGLIPIQKDTASGPSNLTGGEIAAAGNVAYVIYDATNLVFHLLSTQQASAAAITFTQAGVGAVTASLSTWGQRQPIHSKDFLVAGQPDGVTDNTVALQNWITQCVAVSATCYLDAGTYKISSALTISGSISITGAGRASSIIQLGSTTQNGINISTLGVVHLSQFRITGAGGAASGDLINLASGTASPNQFSTFRDLWFQGGWNQLHALSAATWTVDGCLFASPGSTGAFIEDTTASDAGDQIIANSVFSGQAGVGTAIFQQSAGGLKVVGNKIIQWQRGYWLSLSAGVATSDLFFSANSMEAFSVAGIQLDKGSGTNFGTVVIVGNEINGTPKPIQTDTNASWLNNITITGNIVAPDSGVGIFMGTGGSFNISSNLVQISSGTNTGIQIGANASNGIVANNIFNGITTNYNNSSTSTVLVDNFGLATVASLPATARAGSQIFVTDGAPASSPCTGGSTGSMAFRQNGAWKCF